MKILVTYASPHGSTSEVAAFVGRLLSAYGIDVDVEHADDVQHVDGYDLFIIGSAIHSSMWLPSISRFMFRFEETLASKPIYMFLMCMLVLEDGGYEKALSTYIWPEALERLNISQNNIEAFAGTINWDKVSMDERWLLSVNYEGKKLPGSFKSDYRDWEKIASWVHTFASNLEINPTTDLPVKAETITPTEVENLRWPENPGESTGI